MRALKNDLRKMIVLYPVIFIVTLFCFGFSHQRQNADLVSITRSMSGAIPLGAVKATPTPSRVDMIGKDKYTFVYEKETDRYLAYRGFLCLGECLLFGEEIDDFSIEELLERIVPLEG